MAQWLKKKKILLPLQDMQVQSPGQEEPLEVEMPTYSRILAWRIPGTEEPGGLQSTGSPRVGHDWATNTHTQRRVSLPYKHWEGHKGHDLSAFCFKSSLWLLYGRFKWEILGCKETKWEIITIIHVKDVGGFRLKQCQTKRKMNLRYI